MNNMGKKMTYFLKKKLIETQMMKILKTMNTKMTTFIVLIKQMKVMKRKVMLKMKNKWNII